MPASALPSPSIHPQIRTFSSSSLDCITKMVPVAIATVTLVEAGGPDSFYQAETRYRGRLSVVGPGRSLQISNLSWEDAGPYRAHIDLRRSRITHTWKYTLQVYAHKPQTTELWGLHVVDLVKKDDFSP
ncbi:hypothetical protein HPG69_003911 [Diceros bicornis minor]|uniref:Uncharacterized protein n=1 Tax=Diceros bicornis minor TaxID=77932 RepID=A0A7J7EHW8_DICBM|nr:hypothetical protein HPG69_003911 [Diceros bicornis minor]